MTTKRMISAIDQYFKALSQIDRNDFLSCFSADAELHDPYGGRPFVGSEGLSKWFDSFERTWTEFSIEAEESHSSGDGTAVKWAATGATHSAKRASFSGIDVFFLNENGLISRMDGYWDAPAMLAQIR